MERASPIKTIKLAFGERVYQRALILFSMTPDYCQGGHNFTLALYTHATARASIYQ